MHYVRCCTTQHETGALVQHTCHFAAQQSCLQVEQLSVSREGTDDDGVQMGKKSPEASQHLEYLSWDNYNLSIAAITHAGTSI